jgi:putative spermidine/putrescine transport system substrate-binding protein
MSLLDGKGRPISRRSFVYSTAATAGLAALSTALPRRRAAAEDKVVYTEQYGGAWEEAFKTHVFPKFTEKTGIEVVVVPGAGSKIARLDAMEKSGQVELDVLATDRSDVIKGKNLGLYEQITEAEVPNLAKVDPRFREPDDMSAPNITYWMVLFHNTEQVPDKPDTWEVMWDTKYKGWVTAHNDPGWSNLFPITAATLGHSIHDLVNDDVMEAVWKKLDGLKPQIRRWWTGGADFQQAAAAGEVWIGEAWNGRIFDSQDKGVSIDAAWPKEGGYLAIDHWVVPKGTPRKAEAMALVNFLLEPENQKTIAGLLSYGPTTVGTEKLLDEKTRMRTYGPPGAMDKAIIEEWDWYFKRAQEVEERWKTWIAT